jgi:hypothetical protein
MCGAHGYNVKDAKEIYDRFEVTNTLEAYTLRWNVRIGQMSLVIYMMDQQGHLNRNLRF